MESIGGDLVAMITDFGHRDPYVGVMKGVILSVHPTCRIVDVTHEIPPQDVREAAYVLRSAVPYFPEGTVFLCVVDPGVGGRRRPIAAEGEGRIFVAPDNGILSLAGPLARVVEISDPQLFLHPVSRTFHGRDIFAPVSAHLARGRPLDSVGPSAGEVERMSLPVPRIEGTEVRGEVIRVDRFGNLITNIGEADLPVRSPLIVRVGRWRVQGVSVSYDQVDVGAPLAILGSDGLLEVAVREGSAAEMLGCGVGAPVVASGSPDGRGP